MPFKLPALPYAKDALAPHISAETIDYHHGKHHQAYVNNLNNLVAGTEAESKRLSEIVCTSEGGVFNNAAQVWNHSFYWRCLTPDGGGPATGPVAEAITATFGGFEAFREQFSKAAASHFGSGWAWLVMDAAGTLSIETTANAGCPLTAGKAPLLTCDVWEHAYYVDYRNARPAYIEAFWKLINWDFVNDNLAGAR